MELGCSATYEAQAELNIMFGYMYISVRCQLDMKISYFLLYLEQLIIFLLFPANSGLIISGLTLASCKHRKKCLGPKWVTDSFNHMRNNDGLTYIPNKALPHLLSTFHRFGIAIVPILFPAQLFTNHHSSSYRPSDPVIHLNSA